MENTRFERGEHALSATGSLPGSSLNRIVGIGACQACRARITKCSTERPRCHECRKRHTSCQYVIPSSSRTIAKRTHRQTPVDPKNGFQKVFRLLQVQPEDVAVEIFAQIRQGIDVNNIVRFIQYGNLRLQLSLIPDTSYQFTSPYLADMKPSFEGPNNPYLKSKLYDSLVALRPPIQHLVSPPVSDREAVYHIPYPGARIHDSRISSESLVPSKWTSISSDNSFLRHLLEVYFLYEYSFWPCFHKDTFLDDMIAGRKEFCTSFLVNVIMTAACHGLSALHQRSEFWNPRTYSYQFLAESRRQWEVEQIRTTCSLPTVQAATILGRIYFANGMDSLGWSIWAQALTMAEKLDLFSESPVPCSHRERVSRTITAWGLFSQESFSCFYLMKPPLIHNPPKAKLPDPQDAPGFFGEIWVRYPLAQQPVPIQLGHTFLALTKLRCIMNDIAGEALYNGGGHNTLTLERARTYESMLTKWCHELPDVLQPENIALPTHLQLHMQYHNLVSMTFLPFLASERSFNGPDNSDSFQNYTGFSPAKLISSSKACLETLLHMFYHRHGFDAYYIFLLQVLVQLGFDALDRLRSPGAAQKYSQAALKATRATLILCAKGMRDQGRNFYLSECVFRVMRDKMSPADVTLLKDWAQIKDEDERERLMTEHVQGDYPVNVTSITQDPSEQRLTRLLRCMDNMKLSREKIIEQQDEKTSRSWRSVVF